MSPTRPNRLEVTDAVTAQANFTELFLSNVLIRETRRVLFKHSFKRKVQPGSAQSWNLLQTAAWRHCFGVGQSFHLPQGCTVHSNLDPNVTSGCFPLGPSVGETPSNVSAMQSKQEKTCQIHKRTKMTIIPKRCLYLKAVCEEMTDVTTFHFSPAIVCVWPTSRLPLWSAFVPHLHQTDLTCNMPHKP